MTYQDLDEMFQGKDLEASYHLYHNLPDLDMDLEAHLIDIMQKKHEEQGDV